ncbi:TPA: hypothetical protein EYM26_14095 [Candidatus Poribacteria bacterium]|nr:hypothetical protein [Candidatus Poribacteria bacterium]
MCLKSHSGFSCWTGGHRTQGKVQQTGKVVSDAYFLGDDICTVSHYQDSIITRYDGGSVNPAGLEKLNVEQRAVGRKFVCFEVFFLYSLYQRASGAGDHLLIILQGYTALEAIFGYGIFPSTEMMLEYVLGA